MRPWTLGCNLKEVAVFLLCEELVEPFKDLHLHGGGEQKNLESHIRSARKFMAFVRYAA
jgi:hypothetical protein